MTSRKKTGTFLEIITKINQTTTGWINYYGISNMKKFITDIQKWLNHRLRQMIWKRWKTIRTKYRMLRGYGINHDKAMMLANTRKGYWRISRSEIIHRAVSKEKLINWGLKDLATIYEKRYLKD